MRHAIEILRRLARDAWGHRVRAARATACVVLPLVVLCAAGHPRLGAIATQGGFAGLYAFDEPYRRRSRLVLGVGAALAVAMALGTLLAGEPWAAVAVGSAGATIAAAACIAARVGPPREYFIIFTFLIAAAMPVDPGAALGRAGLVLAGMAVAWTVSMAGALRDASRPERTAVQGALRAVARLLDAVGHDGHGSERVAVARHEAVVAVQRAWAAVEAAGVGRSRGLGARVAATERLLEAGLALVVEQSPPLDPAWPKAVRALAEGRRVVVPPEAAVPPVAAGRRLAAAVEAAVRGDGALDDVILAPDDAVLLDGVPSRWRVALSDVLDRHSAVRVAALRIGAAVLVAGVVANALGAEHPTWVALSAVSVLQGANVALARQRAVDRAVGTAIGVVLAAGVLALDPGLALIVLLVAVFQALTEALILVSYGAAVVCITSLALLLLDVAGAGTSVRGLLDARLLDTALGCAIGLGAGLLLWPRRSRTRLAETQAETIRVAASALCASVSGAPEPEQRRRRREVHVAVAGLSLAQRDATGDELRADVVGDLGWPVTHAVEQLAFVALAFPRFGEPALDRATARRLDATLRALADLAEGRDVDVPPPPPLDALPRTRRAVDGLREVLTEFAPAHLGDTNDTGGWQSVASGE
jgi:uncharacterized membrane protein YccC